VVASGLDIAYPRRHADLHRRIAADGLLLSETPAGVRPDAWRFPARNRIIAALSDAVVVVESRATGGSMHTVDEALARDVPVLAVPGHPGAPASAGTNALLFDGAGMARGAEDVLLAMGITPPRNSVSSAATGGPPAATPAESSILDVLHAAPSSLAEVVAATGRTVEEVAHALATLEMAGRIGRSGAWYELSAAGRARR
jgi:DNA processing protein